MRTAAWLLVWMSGIALWAYLLAVPEPAPEGAHAATPILADRLLGWPPERLGALELDREGIHKRIERVGDAPAAGWFYRDLAPAGASGAEGRSARAMAAEAAFISEHLNMFVAARIERSFAVPASSRGEYGIGPDGLRVRLYLTDRSVPARILTSGARTPDGFGQYVWLEPDLRVVTVPAYHIANLAALLAGPRPAP